MADDARVQAGHTSVSHRWIARCAALGRARSARSSLAWAFCTACVLLTGSAEAQLPKAFERLVMPGPVVASHAKYEQECASCHVRFERQSQRQLCLDCHKEIAEDFQNKAGYHGKSPDVGNKECSQCHTEHEGRNADITGLDRNKFNHDLTEFPLLGKHKTTACGDCHMEKKPFHEAKSDCYSCHMKDDRHKGNLGEQCADCHSEIDWKDIHFDHKEKTDYALTGAHAKTKCVSCHIDEKYKDTPDTCIGCHKKDDEHMGLNGPKCQDCHTTNNWKELLFDHFKRTGFALQGGHSGLKCEDCHEGNKYEVKLQKDCYSCHQKDDKHEGVNGTKCDDCHQVTVWKDVTFDHARDAMFALNGAHGHLECTDCHKEPAHEVKLATDCFGCHENDDPHAGQLGKTCDTCHGELAWKQDVRFDHDLSDFPLLGKHRDATCEDCHETPKYHDTKTQCVDCHVKDDVHKGRFAADCALCHNPNDWLLWTFDHNTQTDFVLDGAHAEIDCHSCHRERIPADGKIRLSTTCGSCHRKDDIHRGEFGQQCEQCHTTTSFNALRVLK